MIACHSCSICHGGDYYLCGSRRIYSFIPLSEAPGLWGSYSQYRFLDRNSIIHKMDPDLPPEIDVMFNPLGAGFHWAIEVPDTKIGDDVVVDVTSYAVKPVVDALGFVRAETAGYLPAKLTQSCPSSVVPIFERKTAHSRALNSSALLAS